MTNWNCPCLGGVRDFLFAWRVVPKHWFAWPHSWPGPSARGATWGSHVWSPVVWSWWSLWLGHFASRCWLHLWPGKHCLCDVCSFLNTLRFVNDCCKSSTVQIQWRSLLPVFREGYFSTSLSSLLAGSAYCIKLQLNL